MHDWTRFKLFWNTPVIDDFGNAYGRWELFPYLPLLGKQAWYWVNGGSDH